MYHSVGEPGPTFGVGRAPFLRHLEWIRLHRSVSGLLEMLERVEQAGSNSVADNAVAVTFDDGYLDNYEYAIPACVEHGVPATVFIAWDALGSPSFRGGLPMMSREHVRELAALPGIAIGSHTLSHPKLSRLAPEEQLRELRDSKAVLEDWLGKPVETFCYPFGDYAPRTVDLVRACGYRLAVTTRVGAFRVDRPFEIPRIPVSRFSESILEATLTEGYLLYAKLTGKAVGKC
jgi:peptidoglycan/xylan/chitin deacetylase (PgdA/CDA1 family)